MNQLVSVIVITYNSSKYILETLESIKDQTYQNIELIVSDDSSKDDTLEICKNWLDKNKDRFVHFKIITVPENTGIPANCNRGIMEAKGEWIKIIAGDDILLEKNIESNLKFNLNTDSMISFSDMIYFNSSGIVGSGLGFNQKRFFNANAKKQYRLFLRNPLFINAPSIFLSREIFKYVGHFYEDIKLLEDQPFILKVLKENIKIYYNPEKLVKYRLHDISISSNSGNKILPDLIKSYKLFREENLKNGSFIDKLYAYGAEKNYYYKQHPGLMTRSKKFFYLWYNLLIKF